MAEPVTIGGGIVAALTTVVGFVNSLPSWLRYFIFLGGIFTSATIEQLTGVGLISGGIEFVVDKIGVKGFVIFEWQLIIIASIAFFILYLFRTQT